MGKDVRPGVRSQHKEHQGIEQSQEVNIDSTDTFVSVVALKNGCGVEGHADPQAPCPMLIRSFHFAIFTLSIYAQFNMKTEVGGIFRPAKQ